MSEPTPFFEAFKRGDVDRDVRMLAAHGDLAPTATEQLALLILLTQDSDPEVGAVATATLDRLPLEIVSSVLGQPDLPDGVREFFAARGVTPASPRTVRPDQPLAAPAAAAAGDLPVADGKAPIGAAAQLAAMTFPQRLKAAMKGSREVRAVLIRDSNKLVASSVLSSPKLNDAEVASFARMANVSEDVLRIIGRNRAWMKNYTIVIGLTKNPKTPLAMSLNLLNRLHGRDLQGVSIDRNVPEPLRVAARKKLLAAVTRT
ncbi:MAG: hypothetical protein GEU82_15800 [Luteitalea sp.]|nr:hypothetical protein [Luteitalea sp.]